jgi:hypothetical protein
MAYPENLETDRQIIRNNLLIIILVALALLIGLFYLMDDTENVSTAPKSVEKNFSIDNIRVKTP